MSSRQTMQAYLNLYRTMHWLEAVAYALMVQNNIQFFRSAKVITDYDSRALAVGHRHNMGTSKSVCMRSYHWWYQSIWKSSHT